MLIILCSFAHGLAPAVYRYLAKRLDDVLYSKSKQRQTFTMGFYLRAASKSWKSHEVNAATDSESLLVFSPRQFSFHEVVHRWRLSTNTWARNPATSFLFHWRNIRSMFSRAANTTKDYLWRALGIKDVAIIGVLNFFGVHSSIWTTFIFYVSFDSEWF